MLVGVLLLKTIQWLLRLWTKGKESLLKSNPDSSNLSLPPGRSATGTALELLISNRIVANWHGGEIEFESKSGETRFKVRLPLTRSPADSQP
jgi:hypothetical protein